MGRAALPAPPSERTRVPSQPSSRPAERSSFEPEVQEASIRRLLDLVADGAPAVAAHMERTARLARALVRYLDLGEPLARIVVLTARLHDVGKLGIPPWVLEKPGPLSEFESRLMREHQRGRENHALTLFPLMVFERWAQAFLDRA